MPPSTSPELWPVVAGSPGGDRTRAGLSGEDISTTGLSGEDISTTGPSGENRSTTGPSCEDISTTGPSCEDRSAPGLSGEEFRDLMACWPTGVVVVTSALDGQPVGCTVTAVAPVSASPSLLLVSLAESSRTLAAIGRAGGFGVNVLAAGQRGLARRFARGDPAERFHGTGYRWVLGVPVLPGAVTVAVCALHSRLAVADHVLTIGSPRWWQPTGAAGLRPLPAIWYGRAHWDLRPVPGAGDR